MEFKYDRTKLFSNGDSSDGLYTFLQDMNDIDYLNTKYSNDSQTLYADKIIESKIKYFYNTQSYNVNGEVLHYNDISYTNGQENNDEKVIQVTPSAGFHIYSNSLFTDKLRDSLDLKYKKQDREIGLGAETIDISLPLTYSRYFLMIICYFLMKSYLVLVILNISITTITPIKMETPYNKR